ncbi:MAG: ferritin-like domain-containing protein [Myxococcaceae bacterium]|nr:ferritin-like domain-containing protein [Myxococcaceae bacterium]
MSTPANAAVAIDGGELALGGGLLALVRPALDLLAPGGVLAIRSRNAGLRDDLPAWCRVEHHDYFGVERDADGADRHLVARGGLGLPAGRREAGFALAPSAEGERFTAATVLSAVPFPERADPHSGFAPRGARVEPGGPRYPFTLTERDRLAPPEVAQLYDQAVAAHWDAARDIPWAKIPRLPRALEAAVAQVMTFLAENELSALYVPARFVPQIHPAYAEVAMFLATQLADEARHIDAFLKRARAGGAGVGISAATTSHSLLTLLEARDFTEASFLLSVLGEGTFLDLLSFIEKHAPDEATLELARRARRDEARHVHFGLAHLRHALAHDPSLPARFEAVVRERAARIPQKAVPAHVQDALTVLAAGDVTPSAIARGHEAFRGLLETMREGRVKRLENAGLDREQAERLSELHTPNFM